MIGRGPCCRPSRHRRDLHPGTDGRDGPNSAAAHDVPSHDDLRSRRAAGSRLPHSRSRRTGGCAPRRSVGSNGVSAATAGIVASQLDPISRSLPSAGVAEWASGSDADVAPRAGAATIDESFKWPWFDENGGSLTTFEAFDPDTDVVDAATLPEPRDHFASPRWTGGSTSPAGEVTSRRRRSARVGVYDPAAQRWSTLAQMPTRDPSMEWRRPASCTSGGVCSSIQTCKCMRVDPHRRVGPGPLDLPTERNHHLSPRSRRARVRSRWAGERPGYQAVVEASTPPPTPGLRWRRSDGLRQPSADRRLHPRRGRLRPRREHALPPSMRCSTRPPERGRRSSTRPTPQHSAAEPLSTGAST